MIELPESLTLASQAQETLVGKTVARVHTASSVHKFCFFNGDSAQYEWLLAGKTMTGSRGHGMYVDLLFEHDITLSINDGVNMRHIENAFDHSGAPSVAVPVKYQLLIEFTDASALVFTVAMYGSIWAFTGTNENTYYQGSLRSVPPLSPAFDSAYFASLLLSCKKDLSAKAFLATEQRIPGLGNGCVQDILFACGIHPKRKMSTLGLAKRDELFTALKSTLTTMTAQGGRNTEKNLFGNLGGYTTRLCKHTYMNPCPRCGGTIKKEAYLGGSVYYCPVCQEIGNT